MRYDVFVKLFEAAREQALNEFLTNNIESYRAIELKQIWEMSNVGINSIIEQSGKKYATEFSRDMGIPHRTLQRWQQKEAAPKYLMSALAYIVYIEREQQ